jgi:hypothetical protein
MYRQSQKGNNAPKQNTVCLFVAFYARTKRLKDHNDSQLHSFLVFFPKYREENRGYVAPYHVDFMNYISCLPYFF